tara:strand:+ start:10796 stop:11197 length:402 start_codon:yes stop_codon:yes gene_type:complete
LVVAGEAAAEDFEEGFEVTLGVGAINHSERAGTEGGVELAHVVAGRAVAFDDHDRWRGREAGEETQEAGARFFGLACELVEGEGEIHDRDVDGVGVDDALGGVGAVGDVGLDAHGFEHSGETVNPGIGLPTGS